MPEWRPGFGPSHGPEAEDAVQHVERLAHLLRVRVRAEVDDAAPVPLAREHHARELVLDRDRDVRERLVVAQPHVERRPVPLDEVLLEVQRLDLGARDDHLDVVHALRQLRDRRPVAAARLEVRAHARAQRLRLADVEDLALLVAEEVDARLRREALQLLGDALGRHEARLAAASIERSGGPRPVRRLHLLPGRSGLAAAADRGARRRQGRVRRDRRGVRAALRAPARVLVHRRPARLRLLPLEDQRALRAARRARRGAERDAARRLARDAVLVPRDDEGVAVHERAQGAQDHAAQLAVPRRLPVREDAAVVRAAGRAAAARDGRAHPHRRRVRVDPQPHDVLVRDRRPGVHDRRSSATSRPTSCT